MPFVTSIDNKEIYYEIHGEGKHPIVLIPGWAAGPCSEIWNFQLELATKYKLILIDLIGYGKSEKGRDSNFIHLYGQDVKKVIEKLNLSNVILVGWSMGGAVMLEAEKLLAGRTIGLIAVDSLIQKSGYERLEEDRIKQAVQPFKDNFMQSINNLIGSFMSYKMDQKMIEDWLVEIEKLDSEEMIEAYSDILRWDMKELLSDIDKPIKSIVAGRTLSTEEQRELHKQLFDTVFIEDVGHLVAIEDPKAFNKVLDKLITELIEASP